MSSTPSRMPSTTRRPDFVPDGQVDLGDVAGDDDLGAEAEAGEEHLHLLGRGVLRLVEDDERVVERPAAQERQRGDLDGAGGEQLGDRLGVDHVVQRVVERAQVGVDLLAERAGQEAEPLPRLDGRAAEDDPVDLLGLQRLHGLGHREVGLAGAGRADAEGDRVLVDRVDVALLVERLGPDRATAVGQDVEAQHVGRALGASRRAASAMIRSTVSPVTPWPVRMMRHDLVEEALGEGDLGRLAGERDPVAADVDARRRRRARSAGGARRRGPGGCTMSMLLGTTTVWRVRSSVMGPEAAFGRGWALRRSVIGCPVRAVPSARSSVGRRDPTTTTDAADVARPAPARGRRGWADPPCPRARSSTSPAGSTRQAVHRIAAWALLVLFGLPVVFAVMRLSTRLRTVVGW